jgi:hypothetical protein
MATFKFKAGDRVVALDSNFSIWCEVLPGNTLTIQAYLPDYGLYKVLKDGFKFPVFMKESQLSSL